MRRERVLVRRMGRRMGAGKENGKANGTAKAKEKSLNYLIRQDSPLPLPVPRKKSKPKVQIRKEKDFPNAPMGELICSLKKHPPPPPRLPDRTGAGVRAAEAAASGSATGSELPHASTIVVEDEEKEEDDEDEEKEEDDEDEDMDEDKDKEYEEQNLFVVPPLQAGADMSDDDTSDGYKESADELEGHTMSEESLVHVVSSEEEARERKRKKNKRPRANAHVRMSSDVWAHFHKVREPDEKTGEIVLKAVCNYCNDKKYAYKQGGSTSTIGRHHLKCKGYKSKMARDAIQTTLELRRINGTTSGPTMHPSIEYDQGIVKELIAKMICVHEYSFRMVEHEWFNILMKCMNPNYKPIGRKAIRAECMIAVFTPMIVVFYSYGCCFYSNGCCFLLICLLFLLVCFLIHSNAIIFDPRYKMGYIEWAFGELYGEGSTRFRTEIKIVEKELAALYDKCVAQDKRAGNGESSSSSANIPSIPVQAGYESFLSSRSTRISKSELRNYLEDEVAPRNKALHLLGWWKDNAPRYPIMAKIARRFLTIPATSVSSESTFSTTGYKLVNFSSSN
ncbi:uncharacterized protein [Aegilops tauschii subsp. strangulata]|uniref:uncharacterized protein isoform X2 n=1 Tax=Aegilops tauschii subsp. strangulata TaxID=200361 RepID=UPI003CC87210